jgi:hypothetical protein
MKLLRLIAMLTAILYLQGCLENNPGLQNDETLWHGISRSMRYFPEDGDFVIHNGTLRFNRALYGTQTGFRVEAGDLPEFALYLPGVGGNFKMGFLAGDTSKWMIDAATIEARYRPGSMIYEIRDPLLGEGVVHLTLLARAAAEGMILRCETRNMGPGVNLFWAYGGASGKRFSRSGDIGADPESSFYLKPEYCTDNSYLIEENSFALRFKSVRNGEQMQMDGVVPPGSQIRVCDSRMQQSPEALYSSGRSDLPVVAGVTPAEDRDVFYFMISRNSGGEPARYEEIPRLFGEAEQARNELAERITLVTPDPYINTFGGALAVAADAIWEEPSYLHGAVAWRMRLPGWRGAYAGDWLGWHDRARKHFEGYAKAQYDAPPEGPNAPDPDTHLARQVEEPGHSLFTRGYISRSPNRINRPHHYDMNLVFVNQLLWHILWTGDIGFARQMWPMIQKHFDWEKRCFDGNGDGLYDAYACIWASDALQYSGGGVTHSSAYNYRANLLAARIAEKLGEDPEPFQREAEKIHRAVNSMLWMPDLGCYGEYKDLLGLQRVHPSPGLWTVYHAIDAGISDPFRSWQSLRYIDTHIPHIPVRAEGMPEGTYFTLSNTNWMPYTWSINNVALAENMHTALANWQAGRYEEAFTLWKSQILESMYLGSSPGNLQQLSFYDAFRGELYRDFADPIGITARTLVEGLFGVVPDALNGVLTVRPGLPSVWDFATLETPEMAVDYERHGNRERYTIRSGFAVPMDLNLVLRARKTSLRSVTVNGREQPWEAVTGAIGSPAVSIKAGPEETYEVIVEWKGKDPVTPETPDWICIHDTLQVELPGADIVGAFDPQQLLRDVETNGSSFRAVLSGGTGHPLFFLQAMQGDMTWWIPVEVEVRKPLEIDPSGTIEDGTIGVEIRNHTGKAVTGDLYIHTSSQPVGQGIQIPQRGVSDVVHVPAEWLVPGSNRLLFATGDQRTEAVVVDWNIQNSQERACQPVDLSGYFNDRVTQIFRNRYLTPRSPYPTLQLPWQGIGDWASYSKTAGIDDSGLRARAGKEGRIVLRQGIPVNTPGGPDENNILFTSLWENYPGQAVLPLSGSASHAYLLMAGSTHHMQSRIANGEVFFEYADGTFERLELINPQTWWPIEQDYYIDDFAFQVPGARPPRLHLKDGSEPSESYQVLSKNRTNLIEGGAATLLDLPLDPAKELRSMTVRTLSNDVVIGLMGLTLVRPFNE